MDQCSDYSGMIFHHSNRLKKTIYKTPSRPGGNYFLVKALIRPVGGLYPPWDDLITQATRKTTRDDLITNVSPCSSLLSIHQAQAAKDQAQAPGESRQNPVSRQSLRQLISEGLRSSNFYGLRESGLIGLHSFC